MDDVFIYGLIDPKSNSLKYIGKLIKIWDSINIAQKTLQIRHISEVCRKVNNYKTAGGFSWEYL